MTLIKKFNKVIQLKLKKIIGHYKIFIKWFHEKFHKSFMNLNIE